MILDWEISMMTRKEMEELIADYAFGRLDKQTSEAYSKNLANYPDIAQEIEDTKKVFAKIESMDFNGIIDNRTRDLSVRVNQRRVLRKSNNSTSFLIKFGVPAAIVMAIAITIIKGGVGNMPDTNDKSQSGFSQKLQNMVVIDGSVESILDYDYLSLSSPVYVAERSDVRVEELVDYLQTNDKDEKIQIYNQLSNLVPATDCQIYDDIDDMKEEEFQLLLTEIKNVQI